MLIVIAIVKLLSMLGHVAIDCGIEMLKKWTFIYLLVFLFAGGLASQGPGFLDQYAKRIDAHLIEARINFYGFETIAQELHGGSVEALIEHHRKSIDPTFNREADVIEGIYKRVLMLERENKALAGNLFQDALHLMFKANRDLVKETSSKFTPQLTLNIESMSFAAIFGLMSCLIIKILCLLIMTLKEISNKAKKE